MPPAPSRLPSPSRTRPRWPLIAAASVAFGACFGAADAGAAPTWKPVAGLPVSSTLAPKAPSVATRPTDSATVAVWVQSGGTIDRIRTATRPAGGAWPSTAGDLSAVGQPARDPEVHSSAVGTDAAIWTRRDGTKYRVQVSVRKTGGDWQAPVTLSSSSGDASQAHLSIDDKGNIDAVWQRFYGDEYYQVEGARLPVGGAWSSVTQLSTSSLYDRNPQIAAGSQGLVRVVWHADAGIGTRSHTQGGAWTATETIGDSYAYAGPEVVIDPRGVSTIAWSDGMTIMATRQVPGQLWETPMDVGQTPDDNDDASYAATALSMRLSLAGRVVIAWAQTFDYHPKYAWDQWVYVTERDPITGQWTKTLSNDNFYDPATRDALIPTVTTDGSGRVSVCWIYDHDRTVSCVSRGAGEAAYSGINPSPVFASDPVSSGGPALTSDAYGDASVLWINSAGSPKAAKNAVNSVVMDVAGPKLLSLTVPATLAKKATGAFSVAPKDTWSTVSSTKWTFGDGASATGAAVKHAYAAAGTFSVSVTSTDSVGNPTKATRSVVVK